jgi:hypothetical protein
LPSSIAAVTAIDESPRSCTVEECRSITSVWCGSPCHLRRPLRVLLHNLSGIPVVSQPGEP